MKRAGDKIDLDFKVKAVKNGEEEEVNFKNLVNRPTIVSVYMKNNTPSCNNQNKSLASDAGWFDEHGYNLIALSKDGARSHKNYANKLGINYTLVSDPDYKFAAAANSIVDKTMFGKKYKGPSRSAFVIDKDGTILGVIEKIDSKNHAQELKELVKSLN